MLSDQDLRDIISETRQYINLTEAVLEKDYYVTQVIHALSGTENDYFRLIFSGGTCLAKAHKIVKRMSEDIDFKIQIKNVDINFSKTFFLKKLKQFRSEIESKLIFHRLILNEPIIRNEGQYLRIEINYSSVFSSKTTLRPHILLEFTFSDIRLEIKNRLIKTLAEEFLENVVIYIQSIQFLKFVNH